MVHIITDDKLLQKKTNKLQQQTLTEHKIVSVFALLGHMITHLSFPVLMSLNEACWRKLCLLKIPIEQHEVICK